VILHCPCTTLFTCARTLWSWFDLLCLGKFDFFFATRINFPYPHARVSCGSCFIRLRCGFCSGTPRKRRMTFYLYSEFRHLPLYLTKQQQQQSSLHDNTQHMSVCHPRCCCCRLARSGLDSLSATKRCWKTGFENGIQQLTLRPRPQ